MLTAALLLPHSVAKATHGGLRRAFSLFFPRFSSFRDYTRPHCAHFCLYYTCCRSLLLLFNSTTPSILLVLVYACTIYEVHTLALFLRGLYVAGNFVLANKFYAWVCSIVYFCQVFLLLGGMLEENLSRLVI